MLILYLFRKVEYRVVLIMAVFWITEAFSFNIFYSKIRYSNGIGSQVLTTLVTTLLLPATEAFPMVNVFVLVSDNYCLLGHRVNVFVLVAEVRMRLRCIDNACLLIHRGASEG